MLVTLQMASTDCNWSVTWVGHCFCCACKPEYVSHQPTYKLGVQLLKFGPRSHVNQISAQHWAYLVRFELTSSIGTKLRETCTCTNKGQFAYTTHHPFFWPIFRLLSWWVYPLVMPPSCSFGFVGFFSLPWAFINKTRGLGDPSWRGDGFILVETTVKTTNWLLPTLQMTQLDSFG